MGNGCGSVRTSNQVEAPVKNNTDEVGVTLLQQRMVHKGKARAMVKPVGISEHVPPPPKAPEGCYRRSKSIISKYNALSPKHEARKNVAKSGQQSLFQGQVNTEQLFSAWLGWGPVPRSPSFEALHTNFPGSCPSTVMFNRVQRILTEHGVSKDNTIYGQSICPDEINNQKGGLPDRLKDMFGEVFPMGGISGTPFVGKTGFKAFSSHAPDNGNVFVLYGPHIAISEQGEVGKYLRTGQCKESTACGALIAAYNSCCAGRHGDEHFDPMDMQQSWLREHMAPFAEDIASAPDPIAALMIYSFELVHQKMMEIVNTDFGTGKLILLGGLQINMSEECEDHFCPFKFEVLSAGQPPVDLMDKTFCNAQLTAEIGDTLTQTGRDWATSLSDLSSQDGATDVEVRKSVAKLGLQNQLASDIFGHHHFFSWLGFSPNTGSRCERSLHQNFPGSFPGSVVYSRALRSLKQCDLDEVNTLYGQSICPDEINNQPGTIAHMFIEHYGKFFPLGGIGAAPFVGKTGFGAFSAHVPKDGNIFIMYGPHIGVAESGEVGKYLRQGQDDESTACGALVAAYNSCCAGKHGKAHECDLDLQQNWLRAALLPYTEDITRTNNPMAALAMHSYEVVHEKMMSIVNTNFGSGKLVLLGGVQINTPSGFEDHFCPLSFQVLQAGQQAVDLMSTFSLSELVDDMRTHTMSEHCMRHPDDLAV